MRRRHDALELRSDDAFVRLRRNPGEQLSLAHRAGVTRRIPYSRWQRALTPALQNSSNHLHHAT